MEIQLKKETLHCFLPVYAQTAQGEYSSEAVVPDTMPDIVRILDTSAAVYLRGRTISDGRIALEGEIQGTILYLGEEGDRIRKLDLRLPWALSMEDGDIRESDVLAAEVRLASAAGRALNPRKVELSAEVAASVAVFRETFVSIPTGADDPAIQTLTREQRFGGVAGIRQKSFVVTEELSLPAASPGIDTILCYRADASVEETKAVAGKIILQGSVRVLMQYLDTEGAPEQEVFTVPFSQIMESPEEDAAVSRILLQPDACYLETVPGTYGSSTIHLETHLLAQGIFLAEREMDVLADAYSVRHPCVMETETAELLGAVRPIIMRDTLRDAMETVDPPGEFLYGRAEAALPVRRENSVVLPVTVRALYRNEQGEYASVSRHMEAELSSPAADGEGLAMDAPVPDEPYFTLTGGGVEFRLPLELRGVATENRKQDLICSMEVDEDTDALPPDAPSLILIRQGEEGLWALAKRYRSTEEMIRTVNPDSVSGDLLLIPRAR